MSGDSIFLETFTLVPDEAEIEHNYAYRERFEPDDELEGLDHHYEARLPPEYENLTSEEINSWISQEAHDLILYYEVGGRAYYEKTLSPTMLARRRVRCHDWPGL